jgi:sphingomyelin phosphodiesterase
MRTVGKLICKEQHIHPEVCDGVVTSFGDVLFDALYNKLYDSYYICERTFMCPKISQQDHVKDYAKDVLKDKPIKDKPTPTKKSTYTVMHFTDPHIDLDYEIGSNAFCDQPLCCRSNSGTPIDSSHTAQYWGTLAGCDIPERTFQQFLQYVANNFDVDMILWTGDNVSHDIWQQNAETQAVNTYDATQDLIKYFPNTHIYPMFGNHEPYPADEFDFTGNATDWLKESLSSMWKGWLDEEALEVFRENSYYSMVNPEHNVKVIALNTIACDNNDFYLINDPTDPSHQLQWLRKELYDAETKEQGVFIIGHIPPGSFNCDSTWSARYRALVDRFTHVIKGQFFGHSHKDQFEVVRSYADNSPVGAIYIAPSMTTFTGHHPSFRIFEIDSETNIPVNYYQYRLDLDKWNKNTIGPIEWDLAYNFIEEYGVKDMSFESVDQVADKIKSDEKIAQIYAGNLDSTGESGPITKKQLQHLYCEAKYSVSMDALQCLGLKASAGDLMNIAEQMLPGAWHFSEC